MDEYYPEKVPEKATSFIVQVWTVPNFPLCYSDQFVLIWHSSWKLYDLYINIFIFIPFTNYLNISDVQCRYVRVFLAYYFTPIWDFIPIYVFCCSQMSWLRSPPVSGMENVPLMKKNHSTALTMELQKSYLKKELKPYDNGVRTS